MRKTFETERGYAYCTNSKFGMKIAEQTGYKFKKRTETDKNVPI